MSASPNPATSKLRIVVVEHAERRARERKSDLCRIKRLLRTPDRVEPNPERPGRLGVFVPESAQVLRIVVEPIGTAESTVVTIFLVEGLFPEKLEAAE